MKSDIHPANYRLVVFEDLNNNTRFLIKSTASSQETTKWDDGQTYPLVKMHVTSASHPYYTGVEKMIDIEGRIDKFKARRTKAQASQQQLKAKTTKTIKQRANKNTKATEKNFNIELKSSKALKKTKAKQQPAKKTDKTDQTTSNDNSKQ